MWIRSKVRSLAWLVCLGFVGLVVFGCPSDGGDGGSSGTTKLTVLFSGDSGAVQKALIALVDPASLAGQKAGEVPVDEIESLTITITEISMDHAGSVSDDEDGHGEGDGDSEGEDSQEGAGEDGGKAEHEGSGEGEDDDGDSDNKVIVFPVEGGPEFMEVNIKELREVSRALSSVEVPSGKYTKIRLTYKDPVLVLVGDTTEYRNIHGTAGPEDATRLFINEKFELPADQSMLILIDFGGIHLAERGSGDYTLTPKLTVDLESTSATITLSGTVKSVADDGASMVLSTEEGDVTLLLDDDTVVQNEAGNAVEDLAAGDSVTVEATITVDGFDGDVTADVITIIAPAGGGEGAGEGAGAGEGGGAGEGAGAG